MKESMNNILAENISFSPLWKGKLSQAKLPQAFISPLLKNITCICHLMLLMIMILNKHYILLVSRISFPLTQTLSILSKEIYHGVFSKVNFSLFLETRAVICVEGGRQVQSLYLICVPSHQHLLNRRQIPSLEDLALSGLLLSQGMFPSLHPLMSHLWCMLLFEKGITCCLPHSPVSKPLCVSHLQPKLIIYHPKNPPG